MANKYRTAVNITVSTDLLKQFDALVTELQMSRSELIANLMARYVATSKEN